ncbi:MAG: Rrf2 family transcriptional regulator [Candidatus Omnitrophica bacterium]|nr:Rrf2 family transcriptional regulator [Candidatus Omnitrophota bacterium]
MLVGKKGYYLIKVIVFFAFSKKDSFSIKEISRRLNISEKVLEQVLLSLKNKGVLTSKRGPKGGYRLLARVLDLTVLDIVKMSGQRIEILPVENIGKKQIIDNVLSGMCRRVEGGIVSEFENIKIKNLVRSLKKEIGEKGLSYNI